MYECDNDVVDHQVVNIEYEGGVTASMTMSACKTLFIYLVLFDEDALTVGSPVTEAECDRGTRIQGTKGELIGDMETFVSSWRFGPKASRLWKIPTDRTRPSLISSPARRRRTAPR